jgi:hypothetical protein
MTLARIHSRRYHQINRAVFDGSIAIGVLGLLLIVFEFTGPRTGAALGFCGVITAYFTGWNLVCEKSCAST